MNKYLKLLEILSKNKYARILIERIMAETPNFWKKVRHLAIALFLVSTAIITYGAQFGVGESILNIASYVVAIGATLGISAQMTKQ